jgi:hypothetical protein
MSEFYKDLSGDDFVFVIFLFVALMLYLAMWIIYRNRMKIARKGYEAHAKVVDTITTTNNRGGIVYKPLIKFRNWKNEEVEVTTQLASNMIIYPAGSEFDLFYDPDNPSRFMIKGDKSFRLVYYIVGALASIFFLMSVIAIIVIYFKTT